MSVKQPVPAVHLNLALSPRLLDRVDKFKHAEELSRTAAIRTLLKRGLEKEPAR